MAVSPLTVSALNERVRTQLLPLRDLRVVGEVSGARLSGGHLYFDLKDAGAKVAVRVWRPTLQRLTLQVRDGMLVVCAGRIDVWVQGGLYSFIADTIDLAGQGAHLEALQRLKGTLEAEGLFAAERKVPLPHLPRAVGLATAPGGAALRDMVRVLHDRYPILIVLAPCKVQGEGAAESVARAIERLDASRLVDVIIVGRGGGSAEDLWAFNEERLVRAVAACATPIVSAVGHETDVLLTDFAADWRAPTPTAAAERVVPRWADLDASLESRTQRLGIAVRRFSQQERRVLLQLGARLGDGGDVTGNRRLALDSVSGRLRHAMGMGVRGERRHLDAVRQRMQTAHPMARLARQQRALDALRARLVACVARCVEPRRLGLDRRERVLGALDPRAALRRGFGIVRRRVDGAALSSVAAVRAGDTIDVIVQDGTIAAVVEAVEGALAASRAAVPPHGVAGSG